ncbi:hypothetical protein C7I87_06395 [Mesorhizobium sp. SARCC-RB16n]|uniref:hypothetical protein n=1 Tax=Mesorhizobium sp. SARCC-RB16n TaxID=2116687 RepID=UPI00122F3086|nr:hypothetical protein [Mesorhizobium sp. SARCC-RB16n]KAA3451633.1 hypothetical protein C7I87_06395 [Mesorhizobium sp. SARCC-RB16n]
MPDIWNIDRSLRGSFIVDAAVLKRIYSHIEKATGKPPSVDVTFANQRTVSADGLDSILADSTVSSVPIVSILITSNLLEKPMISFRTSNYDVGPINIRIGGDRDKAVAAEETLVNEIQSSRAWYSGLNLIGYGAGIAFFSIILLITFALIVAAVFAFPGLFNRNPSVALIVVLLAMFGVPLLSRMFFPAIVYHFGVGERRFTRLKALYGLLFGAIILGIVINLASGYIASRFHLQ